MVTERAGVLTGKRVLIVEDEWLLADHLESIVTRAGATVVGPVASVAEALDLLAGPAVPDMATLNVKLDNDLSYPVADRLADLGIPYLFISANELRGMPERFHHRPLLAKPFTDPQVTAALNDLLSMPSPASRPD